MRTFKIGGVHPPENKLTASQPIIEAPLSAEVTLMLGQHIGRPATPVVAKGDHVVAGQMVAEAAGPVSAAVHTPVSGVVTKIATALNPQGFPVDAITIKADPEQPAKKSEGRAVDKLSSADIIKAIADAGIVGLGGATFPTPVKLTPPPSFKPELVIINAAECEPYLTNDHALMLESAADIVEGTRLLMRAAGVGRGVIAIENNKPDAIKALREAAGSDTSIEIIPLKVKYPQGGEKQLIEAVTGRRVPSGGLPVATGAIVQNVATAYAVARAVIYGEPLTSRVVTVTGDSVSRPGNYRVALGTPLRDLVTLAGGEPQEGGKIVIGGPMMGRAAMTLDTFTTKGLSGVLFLGSDKARRRQPEACIRCGKCVDACPMGLEPYLLATFSRLGRFEDAEREAVTDCLECGSCSFSCPASRPILDYIRVGKQAVMAARRARQQKK